MSRPGWPRRALRRGAHALVRAACSPRRCRTPSTIPHRKKADWAATYAAGESIGPARASARRCRAREAEASESPANPGGYRLRRSRSATQRSRSTTHRTSGRACIASASVASLAWPVSDVSVTTTIPDAPVNERDNATVDSVRWCSKIPVTPSALSSSSRTSFKPMKTTGISGNRSARRPHNSSNAGSSLMIKTSGARSRYFRSRISMNASACSRSGRRFASKYSTSMRIRSTPEKAARTPSDRLRVHRSPG